MLENSMQSGFSRRTMLLGSGAAALTLAGGVPSFSAAWAKSAAAGEAFPRVAGLIDAYVSEGKVANMVAALGMPGEPAPLPIAQGLQTLGMAGDAGMDTIYRIYSMTKPITGMAVMMLIDQGKLGLDQPLHDILPKFAEMKVQKVYDGGIGPDDLVPAERPITIRHLLTHTAGLGYSIIQQGPLNDAYIAAQAIPGQVTKLNLPEFARGEPAPSLEVFADRLAELPLVYQPGTRWSYAVGIDLLGRVIEVVSGQPFDSFLQENIFAPCGMTSTWFTVPRSEMHRMTTNYGVVDGALLPLDPASDSIYYDQPNFPYGGAGLASTPRDYDRFLRMLAGFGEIDGTRVMSELAVRVGTSDLFPDTMDPVDEMAKNFGFGAAGRVGKGDQAGIFGWAGAAGTIGFVDMKSGLRMGLFTQYMPMQAYPLFEDYPAAVLADLKSRNPSE